MLGNLISLAEDLKQYPDQWLMHEVQNPSGAMPPYLILSELQRRKLLRSGAASTPPPASSVAQDTVRDTLQQITPPPPAGPPPPPGMASPSRNPPQQGGPMPGAQPPGNMGMPPRGMQEGGLVGQDEEDDPTQPLSIQEMIDRASSRRNLPPRLMRNMAQVESGFNPKAVSPKGAIGPMQLMPKTAASMGIDPTDPQQNVNAGADILSRLMDKYKGNVPMVLAAYNAGEGAVAKYGGIPPYKETQDYVRNIMALMKPPMATPPGGTRAQSLNADQPTLAQLGAEEPSGRRMFQPTLAQLGAGDAEGPALDQPTRAQLGAGDAEGEALSTGPTRAQLGADQPDLSAEAFPPPPNFPVAGGLGALERPAPWQAPIPQTVLDAREQERAASQRLHDLIAGRKNPFDPEGIARNKAAMEAAGLKPRDWSKEDAAVAEAMKAAKQGLHPSISQMLLQMGMGLLASRSPHFGVALGEAGMGTLTGMEKRRAAARDDYVAALRAGIDLSSKKNSYDEKMAELNYAQAKADERAFTDQQKEAEREQAAAHREKTRAEEQFQKEQRPTSWEAVLLNKDRYPPETVKWAEGIRDSLHPGKTGAAAKAPAAATQILNAQVREYAFKNNIPLDESNPDLLSQLPPEHLATFRASMPKTEAAELAKTQKEEAQIQKSRMSHQAYFDKESKPLDDKLSRIDNAIYALNRNDSESDRLALIEIIPATAGGMGSGVRLTQKEIDLLTHGRSTPEELRALLQKWTTGTLFIPRQREEFKQLLTRYRNKIQAGQEAIQNGADRLAKSDDWQKEHWAIRNQVRDELNGIGDHAVSLRDSKGKLRHFDNVQNLPHAQGQSLGAKGNEHAVDLFRDAAGGDPEMIQALARHWGWRVD